MPHNGALFFGRRLRDCPCFARTSRGSPLKNNPEALPLSLFVAIPLENKFSALYQRIMPLDGALFFLRRLRDSNPRNSFPFTRFPSVLLQPLGQVSVKSDGKNKPLKLRSRIFF